MLLAADRGAKEIKQLKTYSRRDPVEPKVIDADTVIEEMHGLLESAVRGQAELRLSLSQQPQPIEIDQVSLEQILMNLIGNARDAVEYGGNIEVTTSELVLSQDEKRGLQRIPAGRWFQLVVSDDGCGMTPEIAARIFEPFFTTKEPGVGTGLGLSTVHGLVKRARGRIWVDSNPGAGSRFHVLMPYADSAELIGPNQQEQKQKVTR
jgi:signal transduction histidine kinase